MANPTDIKAVEWLKKHNGTGIFVRTKASEENGWLGGGIAFIAAGEVAPFNQATIKRLVTIGRATQDGKRVTLAQETQP